MSSEKFQVYKCDYCGLIIEVLHGGSSIFCCGQQMRFLKENESDGAVEKHVPVIEFVSSGVKVSVGSVAHPMLEEHYIEWIELIVDDKVYRKHLKPGERPEAEFALNADEITGAKSIVAREYCNLHGLWKKVNK